MPAFLGKLWSENIEMLSEQELWDHYTKCLIAHDWTYSYSDDYNVWSVGEEESRHIKDIRKVLNEIDEERSNALFSKHSFWSNHNED